MKTHKLSIPIMAALSLLVGSAWADQGPEPSPAPATNLPRHLRPISPSGAITPPQSFYAPPQASDPIQMPATVPVGADDSTNNGNGKRSLPPLPPGVTGVNFSDAMAQKYPLTPQEIRQEKKMNLKVVRAAQTPVGAPPDPVTQAITMSFAPGRKAPLIKLFANNSTAITFADETGAPWPVSSVIVGNKSVYSVSLTKANSSNMVVITPKTVFSEAVDLIVALKGAPAPLVFNLETGGGKVDYEVNVNVAAMGPDANPALEPGPSLTATNNGVLQDFVSGIPPEHAQPLRSSSSAVQAWSLHGAYYIRTRLILLGTNTGRMPTHIQNSVSGVHVYEIAPVPAVTVSANGQLSIVTLEPKS
jgi:intracellular multiplication protein IcmK